MLKINSISQPHLVQKEKSNVITGVMAVRSIFGVLVTSAALMCVVQMDKYLDQEQEKKDMKGDSMSALVFSCL